MGSKKRKSLRNSPMDKGNTNEHSKATLQLPGEGILERLCSTPCVGKLLSQSVRWSDASHNPLLQFAPDTAVVEVRLSRIPPQNDSDVSVTVTGAKGDSLSVDSSWRLLQTGLVTQYSLCTEAAGVSMRCHLAERSVCVGNSVPWLIGKYVPVSLSEEISHFVELIKLTQHEIRQRQRFIDKVRTAICAHWESAAIHKYGSFAYGLSLPHSDVDLCIMGTDLDPVDGLQATTTILERTEISCRPILSARVPVVKLRDRTTGIVADLTWAVPSNHVNVLDGVACVAAALDKYPVAVPIILVLKSLLRQHEYHEPKDGGLSSLALTVLVIAFFGAHSTKAPRWHQCLCPDFKDPGELLIDFLRFYGLEFDYLANFITLSGSFPPVSAKSICPQPTALFDRTGMYTIMVVQDPINLENNLASCCRESRNILQLFGKCHSALTSGDGARSGPSMLSLILSAEEWLWERKRLKDTEENLGARTEETPQTAVPAGRKRSHPLVPLPSEVSEQLVNGGAAHTPSPCPVPFPSHPGTCVHQRLSAQPFHVKQLLQHLRPPFEGRPAA
eukprot:TRINITY_DN434_c0_g1_i1.p1 TRINITY_DN434_c0_g1~~TRINITY_DN434_c0_g1_i1.p1  ORF type:complete len:568 (+),score=50.08 TRINITY_DN434_c0_g1_i1:28-1704(+)